MNSRISARERNLIKGAIRRVFSRSELRRKALDKTRLIGYTDLSRPRVKNWCKCPLCGEPEAQSYMEVDHKEPIVPTNSTLEDMSWDDVVNRIWCEEDNLQAICTTCHALKSKSEAKQRSENKKRKKESKK